MNFFIHKSYKRNVLVLLISFLILIVIAYQMAIKETIAAKRRFKDLNEKIIDIDQVPGQIEDLENQLAEIQQRIGNTYSNFTDIQEALLEEVTRYCQMNKLLLVQVPKVHRAENMNYIFETSNYIIEGRFIPLVRLLNHLEKGQITGKVISAEFEKHKDLKSKRLRLRLSVYIQNVKEKNQNE